MIQNLPTHISVIFIISTFITFFFILSASPYKKQIIFVCSLWLVIQGLISYSLFYTHTNLLPPRFLFLILPPFVIILFLFATAKGKIFIESFSIEKLTLLHCIRVPVELVLYWLFIEKKVPEIMTFEGNNLDILSGISAPIIYYFGFIRKVLSTRIILFWNFFCLALLFNIVITAILSSPLPIQQIAFEQPNLAVLYFPFSFLPGFIVPIVLFSHLAAIKKLSANKLRN